MIYPFLEDHETISFIKKSKVMIFLSGFGNDDKPSQLSEKLKNKYAKSSRVVLFSSDLSECIDKAIQDNIFTIIIDNASDDVHEMKSFYKLAHDNCYIEMSIKAGNYDETYYAVSPEFFGWFMNEYDSKDLRNFGKEVLKGSFKFKEFADDFWKHCDDPTKDFLDYFTTKELDVGDTMLHCTAMYHTEDGFQDYAKIIAPHIGEMFKIEVIGFLITPRTFGARLKLGCNTLYLWDSTDPGDITQKETDQWKPSIFSPTHGRGSRAHLTLLTAPGIKPVETGKDLIEMIKLEEERHNDVPQTEIIDGKATIRYYGEGQAMVYLKEPMAVPFLFSGFN